MNDGTGRQKEPQSERGAPGSRDMGSTGPGGGPADRPAGAFEDDEMISADPGDAGSHRPGHTTTVGDADAAVPPYEGRTERGDVRPAPDDRGEASTGGAGRPVADETRKSAEPSETPGGATTSPTEERPAG
ncbi:hypothetical protein ACWELP_21265 [Rhodococcus aetherivorans]